MNVSNLGLIAIARHEGVVLSPYLDIADVWTFGIGHAETAGTPPNPADMPRGMPTDIDATLRNAFTLFRNHLGVYEAAVVRSVHISLAQHEYDALVSLCFNIGAGAFQRSSVVRHLSNNDKAKAAQAFLAWNKARVNGVLTVSNGLKVRREAEKLLFETGDYGSLSIPVWSVINNRPDMSRPLRTIGKEEALRLLASPYREIARIPDRAAPSSAPIPSPAPESFLTRFLKAIGVLK